MSDEPATEALPNCEECHEKLAVADGLCSDCWARYEPDEPSPFITVMEHIETGDRLVYHGRQTDRLYTMDDDESEFVPLSKPLVVLDVGVPLTHDEVTTWCRSDAGRALLAPYVDDIDGPEPEVIAPEDAVADGSIPPGGRR
jgi:hypothetical protein